VVAYLSYSADGPILRIVLNFWGQTIFIIFFHRTRMAVKPQEIHENVNLKTLFCSHDARPTTGIRAQAGKGCLRCGFEVYAAEQMISKNRVSMTPDKENMANMLSYKRKK